MVKRIPSIEANREFLESATIAFKRVHFEKAESSIVRISVEIVIKFAHLCIDNLVILLDESILLIGIFHLPLSEIGFNFSRHISTLSTFLEHSSISRTRRVPPREQLLS